MKQLKYITIFPVEGNETEIIPHCVIVWNSLANSERTFSTVERKIKVL